MPPLPGSQAKGTQLALRAFVGQLAPTCVDCNGCNVSVNPHLYHCDPGNTNQQYTTQPIQTAEPSDAPSLPAAFDKATAPGPTQELVQLRHAYDPPTCLAAFPNSSTAPLRMEACVPAAATQRWQYDNATGAMASTAHPRTATFDVILDHF